MSELCGQRHPLDKSGTSDLLCDQSAGHDRHACGSSKWWHDPTATPPWSGAVAEAVQAWESYRSAGTPFDAAKKLIELSGAMADLVELWDEE